jgi:hypothetical protein
MLNNTGAITINNVTIDKRKADIILRWLIRQEAENVRTKARTDVKMIADIQKRIEEEAECF